MLIGLFTGFLAGLVGLGGAELRVSAILYLLEVPLRSMFLINLIVSLVTSTSNFLLRYAQGSFTTYAINLALPMLVTSPIGALFGVALCHRLPERPLRLFLAAILAVVCVRLGFELLGRFLGFLFGVSFTLPSLSVAFDPLITLVLAAFFGFLIGIVAGLIGVAGGEYRVSVLVFLFGTGIVAAGTASQLVSIPTTIVGALRHKPKQRLSQREKRITTGLAAGSLTGVLASAVALKTIRDLHAEWTIELIFLLILSYTAYRLFTSPLSLNQAAVNE